MITQSLSQEFIDEATNFVMSKSHFDPTISELLLIQQQSDLIAELSRKDYLQVPTSKRLSTDITELSFEIPDSRLNRSMNMSFSQIDLNKDLSITKDEDSKCFNEALAEIRRFCSKKTY